MRWAQPFPEAKAVQNPVLTRGPKVWFTARKKHMNRISRWFIFLRAVGRCYENRWVFQRRESHANMVGAEVTPHTFGKTGRVGAAWAVPPDNTDQSGCRIRTVPAGRLFCFPDPRPLTQNRAPDKYSFPYMWTYLNGSQSGLTTVAKRSRLHTTWDRTPPKRTNKQYKNSKSVRDEAFISF